MSRFTAHVTRDGRFWLIHVPEIDRYTQARHLREIDTMARDLVAVMTGEDPAGIQLSCGPPPRSTAVRAGQYQK